MADNEGAGVREESELDILPSILGQSSCYGAGFTGRVKPIDYSRQKYQKREVYRL